jgi:hypothetical protein
MSAIQIDQMTLEEKLLAMESLWDDLCRREANIPMPQWHKDVLDERERLVRRESPICRLGNRQAEDFGTNFMTLEILDQAEADLIEGFHFYEAQQSGVGDYFLANLYADIESLRLYAR